MAKQLVILIAITIMLINLVYAMNIAQTVKVTVVPGFLNVYSPLNKIYQSNQILINLSVNTNLKVDSIFFTENKEKTSLCSHCNNYANNLYFLEGKHNITIKVDFTNHESVTKNIIFTVDSNSEVYILSGDILKKATSKDIVNYLFNYNFTIIYENDTTAPEDSCSVVASKGNATLNSTNFGNINNINFYSITSIEQGQGAFTAQKGKTRISISFIINKTLQNSDNLLELQILNTKTKEPYVVDFNKTSKTVTLTSQNLSIVNMKVSSSKGCSSKKASFYFLQNNGKTSRTIQEVRQILNDNPIFLARHQNLNFLFTISWQLKKLFGIY